MSESFKKLLVWQRAIQLTIQIYGITATFPASERFGLTNQLRRAAVSIASNIAEGYGRASRGEYIQFLGHARGSSFEVETQLAIARALGLSSRNSLERAEADCIEVSRTLAGMLTGLRRKN